MLSLLDGLRKSADELPDAGGSGQATVGNSARTSGLGSGMSMVMSTAAIGQRSKTIEKPVMAGCSMSFFGPDDANRVVSLCCFECCIHAKLVQLYGFKLEAVC